MLKECDGAGYTIGMSVISPVRTIADLLHRLGDIPADRIRFVPAPGTASKTDLLAVGNDWCELVEGTLVEKPVGLSESFLAGWLLTQINMHVLRGNLGFVTGGDGFYELQGGTVRAPDVAFTAWERLDGRRRSDDPIPLGSPNLVVEVLSRGNTKREMEIKREEYFGGDVKLVWEIDPRKRTVRVYASLDEFFDLAATDTLRGEPVLPGFELALRDLFGELDRHG